MYSVSKVKGAFGMSDIQFLVDCLVKLSLWYKPYLKTVFSGPLWANEEAPSPPLYYSQYHRCTQKGPAKYSNLHSDMDNLETNDEIHLFFEVSPMNFTLWLITLQWFMTKYVIFWTKITRKK